MSSIRYFAEIIDADMIPGIAINSGASIETMYEMLRIVKKVLAIRVMQGRCICLMWEKRLTVCCN